MGEQSVAEGQPELRAITYCIVPRELAAKLHDTLRRHFRADPTVEVVVERRAADRRAGEERREEAVARAGERRLIRARQGRRVADRRATVLPVGAPPLPRRAREHADRLSFVERLEPSSTELEDTDTASLVTRFQAGDQDVFATLYERYFDRVYGYMLIAFNDRHEAEDATQQVFMKVLEALPRYERRAQPFRAWLFRIVRNHALTQLEKRSRTELFDPTELSRRREPASNDDADDIGALDWITDRDLLLFIERLPQAQRQVLVLRYMLDLTSAQVAAILGRNPEDVRSLQRRAIAFLRERLTALGRHGVRHGRPRMRRRRDQAVVLRSRRFAMLRR